MPEGRKGMHFPRHSPQNAAYAGWHNAESAARRKQAMRSVRRPIKGIGGGGYMQHACTPVDIHYAWGEVAFHTYRRLVCMQGAADIPTSSCSSHFNSTLRIPQPQTYGTRSSMTACSPGMHRKPYSHMPQLIMSSKGRTAPAGAGPASATGMMRSIPTQRCELKPAHAWSMPVHYQS